MSTKRFGRWQKAAALVPLALLSAAWTASLAGSAAATAVVASQEPTTRCPTAPACPTEADRGPGQRVRPPTTASASASRRHRSRSSPRASTNGIPAAALAAYQRAETVINSADQPATSPGS